MKLAPNEYIVAGSGIVVEFAKSSEKKGAAPKVLGEDGFAQAGEGTAANRQVERWRGTRCGIGHVDEVKVNADGTFSYLRRLNGDQDHQGRHVRISVGDWKILHVQLYEYK